MEVGVMLEVTRGQVDNDNNSQSQYLNILNNIQSEGLIYKSESIAIRNGKISEYRSEHRKVMSTARIAQKCFVRTGTGTKLEMGILRMVLVIPEFKHRTKFWESRESV